MLDDERALILNTAPACISSVVRDDTIGDLEKTLILIEDTTASRANSIPTTVARDRALANGQIALIRDTTAGTIGGIARDGDGQFAEPCLL